VGFIQAGRKRLGVAGELLAFFSGHKRWWMLPLVMVVLLTAVLVILAQSSALAPFIYTLF
jgi:hypothetical protein